MNPALRRAGTGLAVFLALASLGASLTSTSAFAKDEDERRALKLEEVERQGAESAELRLKAEQARLEAIERLKELLAATEDGDRKAEMMLRLSDLYFEQGRSLYFGEMEDFQKRFDQCFNTSESGDDCDKVKADHAESFAWYARSVKLYEAILRAYPRYAKADQATYYLGMTYREMEKEEDALESFRTLVKHYPQSSFVPDAYVLIGDYYFDHNEAFPALRAYLKATSYKESERYGYAMYKLAWSYYNVEEYGKAIDTMKAVVAYSMEANTGKERKIKLEDEALKDLVRFFADAGEMDEAYEYFTKLGRKDLIRSALARLASLYFEQGKFQQSVETYRRLMAEDLTHKDNPGYQETIISAYRKMGDKNQVLDEIRRLRNDYGRSSAWWRANSSNPEAQAGADETIEKALRRTATDFNAEARDLKKSKHPRAGEAFEAAVAAYYVYLEDYSKSANAYNVHYDFAELLYDLKRYEEAYKEYMTVVEMDPNGQHSRFCAESAIFASEEMVKQEGGGEIKIKRQNIPKDQPPIALTQWEQRLVDACARYAKLYPKDSKVETAIYKAAFLLYNRFHFNDAATLFRDVIAMNPKSQNAEYSANLILDALNIREEWVPLRDTAKAFYEQESLGSAAFKKEMYTIYSSAAFTVIEEDFKKNQDYLATAGQYVGFYKQFPDFDKVDVALNNAAAYYYKADHVADAMEVRHILVEDAAFGPKTKFYYGQVAALGYDYERLADFDKAAYYYDKLWNLYPDERAKVAKAKADDMDDKLAAMDSQAADALYTSAVFHSALGSWEIGIERYQAFIKAFPKDERVVDVDLVIARTYEEHGVYDKAATAFSDFYTKTHKDASPEQVYFARLHHGRDLLAQGKAADALKVYQGSVDAYRKYLSGGGQPGAQTEFVAEMMYELTKDDAARYEAIEIKGSGSRNKRTEDKEIEAALKRKTQALVELTKKYTAIIETGAGEWGLTGIVALGRAHENMGETLNNSPCPFYLTADQCEIYKFKLQDKAFVQTEKAVEAYKLALDKSYELNLYNDNAAFATRQLGKLRPDDYPGLVEQLPKPGLTSDKSKTFEVETSLN